MYIVIIHSIQLGSQEEAPASPPVGLEALVGALSELGASCQRRARASEAGGGSGEPFVMAVDHCFAIRGQGTVLTGTVLSGAIKLNQVRDPTTKNAY